jgi:3-oxochol-4-en-24-oyl-CoA dehydrogenase
MNFDLTPEQEMVRETFARYLDENSTSVRVRAAMPSGFDQALWSGLAELGAFAMRVPESAGGMGMGLFEAALLMEEAGRTLASGPVSEALVAARLLGQLGGQDALLERVISGDAVVTIALHDIAAIPEQWVAGGLVAEAMIGRIDDRVVLVELPKDTARAEENLASTPIAEIQFAHLNHTLLASGPDAVAAFEAALEEWKLLMAAGLSGLAREALRLGAAYACERKAFGVFIGTFQAISHPLADLLMDIDGGKFLLWKAIRDIADGNKEAAATISLATWWNADTAARTSTQSLHTFGGYGLTTEYDIHLYALRSKAWPLVLGDPQELLSEAGRRLYDGEKAHLPDAGEVPIDFDLGDEARAIQQELRDFFATQVTAEQKASFHYSFEGYNPDVHKKLIAANLAYLAMPKDVGGRALNSYAITAAREVLEEENWTNPVGGVSAMVALIINRFGSDELKRDVLSKIMSGDAICSLGFSEPGSGSDVFNAQCKATPDGNGWRIDGTKMFTSGANISDYVLMLTRTNSEVAKHKGLTMFIVPLKAEGVTIQPVHTFQDERTNITFYDGVKIPDSYRLGDVDAGVRTMSASLELEHGGGFAKVQQAMLDDAVKLCSEIKLPGGKRLIDTEQAQRRLARTAANVMVSLLIQFRANWVQVEGKPNLAYGPMAKLFSSEKFQSDSRDLLDLTAPHSLSKRSGPAGHLNLAYRHAHGTTIYGGTSEVHRSMVAERGLGLPRTRS